MDRAMGSQQMTRFQRGNCYLSLCSALCDYMLSVVPLLKLCCEKSDLDMVQLVEHMSNPMSKSIPDCMYIRLLVGADSSMISSELKKNVMFHLSKSLFTF